MLRLIKNTIKQVVFLPLFIFSAAAISQPFEWSDALQLIDESGVVNVPEGYTTIKANAFKNINVKQINLPDGIHTIEHQAFYNSVSLESINIPDSVTFIGEGAFQGTRSLKSIELPTAINVIERHTFDGSGIENINFQNISSIKDYAFRGTNLQSIDLQPGTSLSKGAFNNIDTIEHLFIPSNVSLTGYYIFSGMDNLKSIHIGSNVNLANINYGFSPAQTIISESTFFCRSSSGGICVTADFIVAKGSLESSPEIAGASYVLWNNTQNTFNQVAAKVFYIAPSNRDEPVFSISQSVFCENIDTDNDGHQDCYDQFPNDPEQWYDYESSKPEPEPILDGDSDGILDIFDDSVYTHFDNCLEIDGAGGESSINTDGDVRNNCEDPDDDNDGLLDIYEPFFGTNPLIPDSDFDGTLDGLDAFPLDNTESLDTDTDGIGNNTDTDDDNDGHFDLLDAFPLDANEWMDSDSDGIGNNADPDDDNDGVSDDDDAFPYTASESVDTDGDGVGDNSDAFPNDSSETVDTDLDGIGNNADGDDDNDGVADADDSDPLNDSVGALESQNLFVMGNPVAVNGYITTISVGYDVSDANAQLTGIGYRVHYDSSIFSLSEIQNTLAYSNVVDGFGPYQDVENFDNDNTTDSYITFAWASVGGDWPNVELPAQLADINLFVNWANYEAGSTTSNINFSFIDNAQGYEPKATNYEITVLPATWDFDGDGVADALSDGLMMLRYAFGIQTLDLTVDAISTTATLTPVQIVDSMHRAAILADIDGDDSTDALTDGLLLLRYLFGLRGESLINGVVSFDATRTTAEEIEEYIELYMPDGSGVPFAFDRNFLQGNWKVNGAEFAEQENILDTSDLEWQIVNFDENYFSCSLDDIYTFDADGSFSYNVGSGTYNFIYYSSLINPHNNLISEGICSPNVSPYDASNAMSFELNESESKLTLSGKGAYILWPDIANGIDIISEPHLGPDQVVYEYSKLSDNEIQLYIQGVLYHSRFVLERVLQN